LDSEICWEAGLKVFFIKRKLLVLAISGIMIGIGFWFRHITYFQTVFAPHRMEVAIVIDDFGGWARGINEMMTVPYPLTFAVMPFEEFSYQQAQAATKKGFEIIVHMPFEAVDADPRWYGKKYISTHSTPAEIKKLIYESFQILPMAVGLNNHMGSRATADSGVMAEVFKELRRLNRFYLDSRTTFDVSPAAQIATNLNQPCIGRDVFLDDENSMEYIRRQLKKLVENAKTKGMAVGIGHVGQTGIALAAVLREELPKYEKEGVHFVPLSKLVYTRVSDKLHKNKKMLIGIDPGHGGVDSGAKYGTFLEKDINLRFSQKLAAELRRRGYSIVLTRNTDQLLTPYANYKYKNCPYKQDDLSRRIKKLEKAGVTVIMCIHTNWNQFQRHRGPIVYYSSESPVSQEMACYIQEHLNKAQPFRKLPKTTICYMLQESNVPCVLLELGFLSNQEDRRLLQDKSYQDSLITAVSDGVEEVLSR
jgi:polysaccharide deacetylase 2 family uncharacterized protein YibQ